MIFNLKTRCPVQLFVDYHFEFSLPTVAIAIRFSTSHSTSVQPFSVLSHDTSSRVELFYLFNSSRETKL